MSFTINPLSRIQQFLSIASSNDHWGYGTLGDREKTAYSFFYFVLPLLSVLCFAAAALFRSRFTRAQMAVLLCLLFAYYANLPRLLTRHSLAEYFSFEPWIWTMPLAIAFLASVLLSSRALVVLCHTGFMLLVCVFFQESVLSGISPLQNALGRAGIMQEEISPDARLNDINKVRGLETRADFREDSRLHILHASEISAIADLLLAPGETFLDFTNQSAAYAWSGRENPAYAAQPPSMLSGERSQRLFLKDAEERIGSMPIAIMPANENWHLVMELDHIANNIRHYLVAEWFYNNYRPLFRYDDIASVWVLNSRYEEFREKLGNSEFLKSRNALPQTVEFQGGSPETELPECHDCVVRMTADGLRIEPTGPDPFIQNFERLIRSDASKPFKYLRLSLSEEQTDNFQLFFTSDRNHGYDEKYSLKPLGVSARSKVFDFWKVPGFAGHIRKLRLDVPDKGVTVIKQVSLGTTPLLELSPINWGYDNFISLPDGAAQSADYISNAHDYYVDFLPYIWGQFDSEKAASNEELTGVSQKDGIYSWSYSGHEQGAAYLRLDLSAGREFVERNSSSNVVLGSMENGKFSPLCRFRFSLKEGRKAYLFRISSDYYWSLGKLNALSLDPNLGGSEVSVRILDGD